ncbi:hypothetical protein A3762_15860 [Oleiphilus sp. HI0125]|uniref:DUF642 domain-containing protein n=1 Tax=Oleiphilus sp. HI0125 TaxID=1822266 RepID=UPI0007C1FF96|nr:DUF642 domain-containing protein [Oleiphilus sp. HI0125]KZZ60027.1 hypothetical protein A3762_15860 [Oleiphilus sp. HI0125]
MKLARIITGAALCFSATAQANLILNGGFEAPELNDGSGWIYESSGDVPGWEGSNIEIWESGFNGVTSAEGTQHGELNAHPNTGTEFSIYQVFDTTAGFEYNVSFAYRARSSENETFQFDIYAVDESDEDFQETIISETIEDHTTSAWSYFTATFEALSEQTYIRFTSITPEVGTVGNFLDDVKVTPTAVSEPATLALLGLGLAGLGAARRRQK